MDKVTRFEWHGNVWILTILTLLVITIPLAVIYFIINLLVIQTEVTSAEELSQSLLKRR
ncbi:hypothetical protein Psta_0933 [Pirellula staleyi DSM 6068]|uniref:Uncharacterized protein n=1 Tax=Pirellula staleyi (strain ATCC 27377 / DSM 6068 / ICPB 4128) TaxID=530564 RepID=D2R7C2_PIRSD|nr:hypothetical protein [Pirellula staleyi]ADB15618.1 hypothetical protein Psta_0933 [Pirellula staleyi DSM 6068]